MSVDRRSPRRLLIVTLAVPVILAVYGTATVARLWATVRPVIAAMLGVTVIGSVYASEAMSHAPARVTPVRAAAVLALAVMLAGAGIAPAPTFAAKPVDQVMAIAKSYVGIKYQWGATGPNRFDCSGYIFRVFKEAGELPRVGGKRMRAIGYFKWFKSRGLASKEGKRGDLVVYGGGKHIGIYLGDDKVLSALTTTGISVHPLRGINYKFNAFLNVQWGKGDGTGGSDSGKKGKKNKDKDKDKDRGNEGNNSGGNDGNGGEEVVGGDSEGDDGNRGGGDRLPRGLATGTLNLRKAPGPDEKIIGWVSKGSQFKVLGTGNSPSGALWLNVEMANGKTGWIWAHWTRIDGR
jgi:hypothetical protein